VVALKILPIEAASDPGFAERFTREARALARLSHPNIVGLYDFGRANGLHYFIMEFVDGLNLRQLEQAGTLSPREALQIIPQICEALQFAHDEGIVHRDIKPENVLLDKKGRVKIADFGLARILGHEPEDFRLTRAREVMGTPHYMAPEQVEKPQSVDHRADIYSLGVVFYEMLTGELPLGKFAPPSQKVHIDVRLDEVVLRALEKEPARRYQQASEVRTDIKTILTQPAAPAAPLAVAGAQGARRGLALRRFIGLAGGVMAALAVCFACVWWLGHWPGASNRLTPAPAAAAGPDLSVAAQPPESNLWYYVSGEVRAPNRQVYVRRVTLLQAIASAGGFTDFADRTWVELTFADGSSQIVNCIEAQDNPNLDPEVHPGDRIFAPRWSASDASPSAPKPPGANPGEQAVKEIFARRYGLSSSATPGATNDMVPPLAYHRNFATNDHVTATSLGPPGLTITKLTPLWLKLSIVAVTLGENSRPNCWIGFENEAVADPVGRRKRQYFCSPTAHPSTSAFAVRELTGPAENPTVVLELNDTKERVSLDKGHPYQRVEGYVADLRYGPESKAWPRRRVGSALSFAGDAFTIIAITRTTAVLRQRSNDKTWAVEESVRTSSGVESNSAPETPLPTPKER
jgi:hypothetical protein